MKKMKILFFYESMDLGGQQTQNYYLVKRFTEAGHEVHYQYIYGEELLSEFEKIASVDKMPVALVKRDYLYRPWRIFSIISHIKKYSKENEIDLIVGASGLGTYMSGIAARLLGVKNFRIMGCSMIQMEKRLYKLFNVIRVDSLIDGYFSFPKMEFELIQKGVNADKVHVFNNAVDTDTFFPKDEESCQLLRQNLNISAECLVIGWVGRIGTQMQVGDTIRLGKKLLELGFSEFKLLIVGGGPWFEGIQQFAEELGVREYCIFTNWIERTEVNNYINVMDMIPLLEKDPRGGSIVREAMAAGRIAVSVDGESGSQRDFMHPDFSLLVNPNGYIENAANGIIALSQQKEKLQGMKVKARKYAVKNMSFDRQVEIMESAFADSLN